jgi:AraC family transcriptional regulator
MSEEQPADPAEARGEHETRLIEQERALLFDAPHAGSIRPYTRQKPPPRLLDDPRLMRAIRLIEESHEQPLTLDRLAQRANLSRFHFQRRFLEVMGESPSEYIRRTRLERAAICLLIYPEPVLSIALSVGYASHEAFIRAFHRQFGLVPTQYRQFVRQASIPSTAEEYRRAALVKVDALPRQPLLGMRFYGSYANVEENWRRFAAILEGLGFPMEQARAVGVAIDNPEITPNELVRYDCAVVDTGFDPGQSPLTRLNLPAGRYARLEHRAPYSQIFATYRTLAITWDPPGGKRFSPDCAFEVYRRPPWLKAGDEQRFDLVLELKD